MAKHNKRNVLVLIRATFSKAHKGRPTEIFVHLFALIKFIFSVLFMHNMFCVLIYAPILCDQNCILINLVPIIANWSIFVFCG